MVKIKNKQIGVVFAVMTFALMLGAAANTARADGLDGYTVVDWTQNRDIETTDSNSATVGRDVEFWRYVDADDPANNATWKSAYGDELSDDDINAIWNNDFGEQYFRATIDVDSIGDENIRQYIENHVDESVPNLKLKFDIDADIAGENTDKANELFNGDIGYRIFRDSDGVCKIEIKFVPNFHLIKDYDPYNENYLLPNMPYKTLPRAQYPYSSVLFSMWDKSSLYNIHYGSPAVVEGDDPDYVYGESFGYGDILDKGAIPDGMTYPNAAAGQVNEEGDTAGEYMDDWLYSGSIRIGTQYKAASDLWYYSYGGAVGYSFHFPVKVTLEVDDSYTITKELVNYLTGDIIASFTRFYDGESSAIFYLADTDGYALVDSDFMLSSEYAYDYFVVENADTDTVIGTGTETAIKIIVNADTPHKLLRVYAVPLPTAAKLTVKYVDEATEEVLKEEEVDGPSLTSPDEVEIEYTITVIKGKLVKRYVVELPDGTVEDEVLNPAETIFVPISGKYPVKTVIIYCGDDSNGDDSDDDSGTATPTPSPTSSPSDDEDDDSEETDDEDATAVDPPVCDSNTSTIRWEETETKTWEDDEGYTHRCIHTYKYKATLSIDSVELSPSTLKSGYGFEVKIKANVSYELTGASHSNSDCPRRLSSSRTPTNSVKLPTKATARMPIAVKNPYGEVRTFGGIFIQDSSVSLEKTSSTSTSVVFEAPVNSIINDGRKLYTDLWLPGTSSVPRTHKIYFDISGGGVDGTEWCTTVEKEFTINGDMYEDAGTTST